MAQVSIFCLLILAACCSGASIPPQARLEAIYPRGLRVSIPDDAYNLFGFRGNLNEELNGLETSKWSKDVHGRTNGRWVFADKKVQLKLGDTIYYWIFVMKNGALFRQDPQEWTVTEFVNEDGTLANGQSTLSPKATSQKVPEPTSAAPPCEASSSAVMGRTNICRGDLIFSEEFDKNSIQELAYWDPEVKFPQEPDYPFNVYMAEGTLRLENGRLVISPLLLESKYREDFVHEQLDLTNTCTGLVGTRECTQVASGAQILPPVITGKITTRNKFNFKYGRVEVRAKLPRGSWLTPEITLEPRESVYGKLRFDSGLIRVAFAKGNDVFAMKLYGGPVLFDKDPYRSQFLREKVGVEIWNKEFHNYTMLWKPGFYSQLTERGATNAKHWVGTTRMAPLDEMFYVALGLRVGGINDFADEPYKPWRNMNRKATINFWNSKEEWFPTWREADMKVDYVRIYAL
ncbi:unnamed protein product, partial [Iphiclides podalirius]